MDITTHMLLFMSEKQDNNDALMEFEEAAMENKALASKKKQTRILFVTVIFEKSESKVLTFFGVKEQDCPRLILIDTKDEDIRKFLYRDQKIDQEIITSFVQAYHDN